jgi:hypothetical protein
MRPVTKTNPTPFATAKIVQFKFAEGSAHVHIHALSRMFTIRTAIPDRVACGGATKIPWSTIVVTPV